MLQTSVEIVKPGGTGSPAFVISARPEPLPPRRSFMFRLPSALPLAKKYTCCRDLGLGIRDLFSFWDLFALRDLFALWDLLVARSVVVFFAIYRIAPFS